MAYSKSPTMGSKIFHSNKEVTSKMELTKSVSGVVFDDMFTTKLPTWDLLNASSVSFLNEKLTLNHSDDDTYVVMDMPDAQAFEVFLTYTPTAADDEGGLVLFNTSKQNYKLLEVADAALSDLENIKVVRNNADHFDLYMLRDGEFAYVDSVSKEINKIGFVLKAGDGDSFVPLEINRFVATTSETLRIEHALPNHRIEITTNGETLAGIVDDYGVVEFKLKHLIATYDVKIFDETDALASTQTATFAGGDVFYLASLLTIRESGADLSTATLNHMGSQTNGFLEKKYEIYNPMPLTVTNVFLRVKQYLNEFGYQLIDIAIDNQGSPGAYADTMTIQSISSEELVEFWIKVENTTAAEPTARFTIDLKHD